jgi:plastin-1
VEVEDWVQLHSLLKQGVANSMEAKKGKVTVKGTAGTNAQHTINEDERRSFTEHINAVSDIRFTWKSLIAQYRVL